MRVSFGVTMRTFTSTSAKEPIVKKRFWAVKMGKIVEIRESTGPLKVYISSYSRSGFTHPLKQSFVSGGNVIGYLTIRALRLEFDKFGVKELNQGQIDRVVKKLKKEGADY
jgi:hypothetical protein